MMKPVSLAIVLCTLAPLLTAADAEFASADAQRARVRYERAIEDARMAFEVTVQTSTARYRQDLTRAMAAATRAANLNEANRLKAAIDALDGTGANGDPEGATSEDSSPSNSLPPPAGPSVAELDGHQYKLFNVPLTWEQAQRVCLELGGHLATITDEREQIPITALAANNLVWLGGTDESTESQWRWVTEEPFERTAWKAGQPSNTNNREHHLTISPGGWDDAISNNRHVVGFVCEWSDTDD